tara:strand:+ start:13 stop:414 length:402 start_codon:yes stop_codon:yes gene_type:complete
MKRWWIVLIIVLILIMGVSFYFLYNKYYRCSLSHGSGCDISCETDDDCKKATCSCINKDEKMFITGGMDVMCVMANCRCIDNQCEEIEVKNRCGLDETKNKDECCSKDLNLCNDNEIGYWNFETEFCDCKLNI